MQIQRRDTSSLNKAPKEYKLVNRFVCLSSPDKRAEGACSPCVEEGGVGEVSSIRHRHLTSQIQLVLSVSVSVPKRHVALTTLGH